jgi:hypothetical protein
LHFGKNLIFHSHASECVGGWEKLNEDEGKEEKSIKLFCPSIHRTEEAAAAATTTTASKN